MLKPSAAGLFQQERAKGRSQHATGAGQLGKEESVAWACFLVLSPHRTSHSPHQASVIAASG